MIGPSPAFLGSGVESTPTATDITGMRPTEDRRRHAGITITGRPLVLHRRPGPRIGDVVRVVDGRERRWLMRRLWHELIAHPRPMVIAALAMAMLAGRVLVPLATGMPLARDTTFAAGLLASGLALATVAGVWWTRILRDAIVQHLLVLQRCGRCGHPAPDRGPRRSSHEPHACRSWRCTECGSEWVGAGTFVDAETRRDAA